jgi:hypothetical protein
MTAFWTSGLAVTMPWLKTRSASESIHDVRQKRRFEIGQSRCVATRGPTLRARPQAHHERGAVAGRVRLRQREPALVRPRQWPLCSCAGSGTSATDAQFPFVAGAGGAASETCSESLRISRVWSGSCRWRVPCVQENAQLLVSDPTPAGATSGTSLAGGEEGEVTAAQVQTPAIAHNGARIALLFALEASADMVGGWEWGGRLLPVSWQ